MTTKEQLHKLVDELSEQEAAAALVIVERRRDDPMLNVLASAPLDDEPSDTDEDASAAEASLPTGEARPSRRSRSARNSTSIDARLVPPDYPARAT